MNPRLFVLAILASLLLDTRAHAGPDTCALDAEGKTVSEIARALTLLARRGECDELEPNADERPDAIVDGRARAIEAAVSVLAEQKRLLSCPERGGEICRVIGGLEMRLGLVEAGIANLRAEKAPRVPNLQFQIDFSQRELLVGRRGGELRPVQLCRAILSDLTNIDESSTHVCERGATQQCDAACAHRVDSLISLLPAIRVMETSSGWLNAGGAADDAEAQRARAQRWTSYVVGNDASDTLWPWELWVNGLRHDWEDRDPPRSYVSLIRPAVGLEFYDSNGVEATLTGLVEVIGYNKISYTEQNEREDNWGIGVVAGYGMSDETQELGYGLQMKRLPRAFGYRSFGSNIDITVLYREDQREVSIVFSKSLQSFFTKKPCAYFGACED